MVADQLTANQTVEAWQLERRRVEKLEEDVTEARRVLQHANHELYVAKENERKAWAAVEALRPKDDDR